MRILAGLLVLLSLLVSTGCNEPFDPRAPLQKKIILFSVLSTDRKAQYVQIHSSYMPPTFDPLSNTADQIIPDAVVSIASSGNTIQLRDTLIPRTDTTRYGPTIQLFYASPFVLKRGTTYTFNVVSPTVGSASAQTTVPGIPTMSVFPNRYNLDRPDLFADDAQFIFQGDLSRTAQGYVGHLFLTYDVLKATGYEEERIEVPIGAQDTTGYGLVLPVYPQLSARTPDGSYGMQYFNGYYRATIDYVRSVKYPRTSVTFVWVSFVLLQTDVNLYTYYNEVHQFRDPRSIRLDEPIYSSVNGGVGIAGSYSLDSLVYILPAKFVGNQ